jgi:WD40 repeat protein
VRVWDVAKGTCKHAWPDKFSAVAWSPDGNLLVTVSFCDTSDMSSCGMWTQGLFKKQKRELEMHLTV